MPKLLFTGGAGYIGSHVLHLFIKKGVPMSDIVVVDNLSSGSRQVVPKECKFYDADITDREKIECVFNEHEIDAVLHFAGLASVEESMREPARYFWVNGFGGFNVLSAMQRHDVRKIIFSSTASVYGNPVNVPMNEDHPVNPTNVYAESKLTFERMLAWFDRIYGIKHTILRYFNVCGVEGSFGDYYHWPCAHLVPNVLAHLIGEKDALRIFGNDYPTRDGTCVRDYVDIRDLAEAHYAGFVRLQNAGESETFNLGTGSGYTVKEILRVAEAVARKRANVAIEGRRVGDPSELVCDGRKAREILGWMPQIDIKESIASHWLWFKERHGATHFKQP